MFIGRYLSMSMKNIQARESLSKRFPLPTSLWLSCVRSKLGITQGRDFPDFRDMFHLLPVQCLSACANLSRLAYL